MKPHIFKMGRLWLCTTDRWDHKRSAFGINPSEALASYFVKLAVYHGC